MDSANNLLDQTGCETDSYCSEHKILFNTRHRLAVIQAKMFSLVTEESTGLKAFFSSIFAEKKYKKNV